MTARGNVTEVNDASFDAEVLAADLPVLVDFVARWCPPCKVLAPVVERVAAETVGRVKVVTVDADAAPHTAQRYNIRGLPTLLVFRNGAKTAQHLGATTRERVLDLLER